MFYRLLPTLINEGYVYIAETPLYSISTKDGYFFAYDEKEKQDILDKIGNKKYTIERSKGLGENTAEMMSECAMNPATRRLIRVVPEDELKTYEKFDILLGENLSERKVYIAENGAKYLDMIVEAGLLDKVKMGRSNYYINAKLMDLFISQGMNNDNEIDNIESVHE